MASTKTIDEYFYDAIKAQLDQLDISSCQTNFPVHWCFENFPFKMLLRVILSRHL